MRRVVISIHMPFLRAYSIVFKTGLSLAPHTFRELSEEEKVYLQKTIEDAYNQFLQAILKYRSKKISDEKLREIADGRVFTGRVAKDLGLVDELGNLQDAINRAKQLAGVPKARVFYMEERRGLLRRLMEEDLQGFGLDYPLMLYYIMK